MRGACAALLLAAFACDAAHAKEKGMTLEDNKRLVRALYEECINTGALEKLDRYIADEYAGARGGTGPSGYAATVLPLRQGFPDIRFTVEDLVAEADRVAVRWTWTGTHTGTFNGIPPTGKTVKNDGTVVYRLKDGRIVSSWLQVDRLGVLQQLGLVPVDASVLAASRELRHIGVSIARQPGEVYEFVSDPRNLPRWAAGLARSEVKKEGDRWVAESPMGKVRIRFAEKNPHGVLDHDVTLESGVTVRNPMRVLPRGEGSEFVFTLMRRPGVSDEEFARDAAAVEKDLRALKELLERQPSEIRRRPT